MSAVKLFILILCIALCNYVYAYEVKNSDKPLKGNWDLKLQHQWSVTDVGKDFFTIIDDFKCADNGTLYVIDRKLYKVFVIDNNGRFITAIGSRGAGPGEFFTLRSIYPFNDVLIVVDDQNIHYFSPDGKYKKSIPNQHINFSPVAFITPDTFVSATVFAGADNNQESGHVVFHDLKKKLRKELFQFPKWKEGVITSKVPDGEYTITTNYSYSVSDLTPGMVLCQNHNKLYYGMNNQYLIKVSDLQGKEITRFSLKREKTKTTEEYKERMANSFAFPENIKQQIKNKLPDEFNYFESIFVDENGFIWVSTAGSAEKNVIDLDIFSNTGNYIYKSRISVEKKYTLKNIYMKGNNLYLNLVVDDEELIAKYKMALPKQKL